jgi:hypothetical protein
VRDPLGIFRRDERYAEIIALDELFAQVDLFEKVLEPGLGLMRQEIVRSLFYVNTPPEPSAGR